MITKHTTTQFLEHFNSLREFYDTISTRETNPTFGNYYAEEGLPSHGTGKVFTEFTGTDSWEEADGLAKDGDSKSAKKILNEMINNEKETENVMKKRVGLAPVGFAPCVPAYLAGHPANMYATRRTVKRAPKILNIFFSINAHAGVKTATRVKAGALILSAINSLQLAGYRINLFITVVSAKHGKTLTCVIKAKDAGDHTQVSSLAYAFINPSFLRRHEFRWEETLPISKEFATPFLSSYGIPTQYKLQTGEHGAVIDEAAVRATYLNTPAKDAIRRICKDILAGNR